MQSVSLQEIYKLLGWGDLGLVFELSDHIALKYAIAHGDPRFENENRIFDILERHAPCPHIVYSFLRVPNLNFMQRLSGGNLEMRLRSRQSRNPATGQVVACTTEPEPLILRWAKELAMAAAWLESLGLAHADIRPANLLLDAEDHLKLADFDNTQAIGTDVEVGTAPYCRVLGDEAGDLRGYFGLLGPRTEQFAIGSVFYYMVKGNMEFPHWDPNDMKERVIRDCWYGKFDCIEDLAKTIGTLGSQNEVLGQVLTSDFIESRREECRQYMTTLGAGPRPLVHHDLEMPAENGVDSD
ncbi:hypothetical protein HRR78_003036 [Exophiala dermatitidis]|nr:hypothetical protein HRR75_000480 [Exophiala dermatitidis]KAJ4552777.1 hypothetical protein HRR78_003036 [Exophiala dermatitidis]